MPNTVRPAAALDPRLLDVIARAAAPSERRGPAFRPADAGPRGAVADARVATWERHVSGGSWPTLDALLAHRGLERGAARAGVAPVRVADERALPRWARDLARLLAGAGRPRVAVPPFSTGEVADPSALSALGVDADAPWELHATFLPLVREGAAHLARLRRASSVGMEEAAARQLLAQLAQRFAAVSTQVLDHHVTAADVAAGHPGHVGRTVWATFFGDRRPAAAGWLAVCAEYPVLGRVLAVAFRHWRQSTRELVRRVDRDRDLLSERFAGGRPLGALRSCRADAGDVHDFGRAVAILEFASGARVVYKPKDLRIAAAYVLLTEWLNARGLEPRLAGRTVLVRGAYAWEEFVAAAPCGGPDDVRAFYRRLGMHARLLQLLDGTDFTVDNVVAAGDQPALIDLEMMVSPRLPHAAGDAADARAAALAWDTPVRSGIVTARIVGEEGRRAAEIGALAPAGACEAPFKTRFLHRTADGLRLELAYPVFPAHRATPVLGGQPVDPSAHLDAVSDGYVAMGQFLAAHAADLLADDGPLQAVRDAPVRFLARDTHIYGRLLQASLAPARLRDGVDRELTLERLWRARFPSPRVVEAEIAALRRLDIPLFWARPNTRTVYADGRALAGKVFAGRAFAALAARVARLASRSPADDRALIDAALFTRAPDAAAGAPPRAPRGGREADDPMSGAVTAARALAAERLPTRGADGHWLGVTYAPGSDHWTLGLLGDDVFSGRAGLGLVLAEVGAYGGEPRLGRAARAALAPVARRLTALAASAQDRRVADRAGLLFGWSGWLYACARAAQALHDVALLDTVADAVRRLATDAARDALGSAMLRDGCTDVAHGASGALLVVLSDCVRGMDGAASLADTCAAALEATAVLGGRRVTPPGARWLAGVPGDAWGAALARARYAAERAAGHAPPATAPGTAPGTALGPALGPALTPGDLLAARALARGARGSAGSAPPSAPGACPPGHLVDHASASAAALPAPVTWRDRAELALAAHHEYASDARDRRGPTPARTPPGARDVRGRATEPLTRSSDGDRYFPSALAGRGAVAHTLLRVATRGAVRSIRTCD